VIKKLKAPKKSPKAPRCAAVALIGDKHPNLPTGGPWMLCLSPTQKAKLFPHGGGPGPNLIEQPNKPLGCGVFACVWPDNGDVVKITNDPEDIAALEKAQGNPRVVKLREAFRLNKAGTSMMGKSIPVYAARVERLEPLPEEYARWNRRFTTSADGRTPSLARRLLINQAVVHVNAGQPYIIDDDLKELAVATACSAEATIENRFGLTGLQEKCTRFTQEFLETFQDLLRKGILWGDHHYRNMAMDPKTGHWKIIDLGQSEAGKPSKNVKPLNGAEISKVRQILARRRRILARRRR
jgi:hypothetical protein